MPLFKKKVSRVVAVDMGSSCLKILVADGKYPHSFSVADFRCIQMNTTGKAVTQDDQKTTLKNALGTMAIGAADGRSVVSGRTVVIRVIEMPKTNREELKKSVESQLGRYVPIDTKEAVFDCASLHGLTVRDGWMKCLLVASRRAGIESHTAMLKEASLVPLLIEPEPVAVINAFAAAVEDFDKSVGITPIEAGGVGLIHIGTTHTDLCIMKGRTPVACRSIETGDGEIIRELASTRRIEFGEAIQAAREEVEKNDDLKRITGKLLSAIATEMRTSFDYCQREFDIKCERLYVTGGLANKPSTVQMLRDLSRIDAYRYDPFAKVKLDALGSRLAEFRNQLSAFVPVMGNAVRDLSNA